MEKINRQEFKSKKIQADDIKSNPIETKEKQLIKLNNATMANQEEEKLSINLIKTNIDQQFNMNQNINQKAENNNKQEPQRAAGSGFQKGSKVHKIIEDFINNKISNDLQQWPELLQKGQFHNQYGILIDYEEYLKVLKIVTQLQEEYPFYLIMGAEVTIGKQVNKRIDLLFIDDLNKQALLIDWKRTKGIKKYLDGKINSERDHILQQIQAAKQHYGVDWKVEIRVQSTFMINDYQIFTNESQKDNINVKINDAVQDQNDLQPKDQIHQNYNENLLKYIYQPEKTKALLSNTDYANMQIAHDTINMDDKIMDKKCSIGQSKKKKFNYRQQSTFVANQRKLYYLSVVKMRAMPPKDVIEWWIIHMLAIDLIKSKTRQSLQKIQT